MTTPTLNHDQAAAIRSIQCGLISWSETSRISADFSHPLNGLVWANKWFKGRLTYGLTDAGREALAEHKREFVTVRRDDLHTACDALRQSIDGGEKSGHDMLEFSNELARLRAAMEAK